MSHQRGDARKRLTLVPTPCCDAAAKVARVRELVDDLWRVAPCGCGHRADMHALDQGMCLGGLALCRCNRSFPSLVSERLRAALDGPAGGGGRA